jgi:hypothetical protein
MRSILSAIRFQRESNRTTWDDVVLTILALFAFVGIAEVCAFLLLHLFFDVQDGRLPGDWIVLWGGQAFLFLVLASILWNAKGWKGLLPLVIVAAYAIIWAI